jgi:2-polyprenyl-6-methoxyphenol hydroxylase-like FAD-dependent oxidoreductase
MIGDAAHAMSPIGGVGINLAVQDAVAAANVLVPAFRRGEAPNQRALARLQMRRMIPTRVIQGIQVLSQNRIIAPALRERGDQSPIAMPALVRRALKLRVIRSIPARVFGLGVLREHVHA